VVYVHSYDQSQLVALRASNGRMLWQQPLTPVDLERARPSPPVVLANGAAIVVDNHTLVRFSKKGLRDWATPLPNVTIETFLVAMCGPPVFLPLKLHVMVTSFFVVPRTPDDEFLHLVAVDVRTGAILWDAVHPLPGLLPCYDGSAGPNGNIYLSFFNVVMAFSGDDGALVWRTRPDQTESPSGVPVASPQDGTVYLTSYFGRVWALNPKTGETEWFADAGYTSAGRTTDATFDPRGRVYMASSQALLAYSRCGSQLWRKNDTDVSSGYGLGVAGCSCPPPYTPLRCLVACLL
jgi:outer membrane protein assembly factor BamB